MAKAIFTTKVDPFYDDLPEVRYHFPRTYLRAVEQTLGDWILYYEPRRSNQDWSSRGGRQAYFATAKVQSIQPDPVKADHYYAFMTGYMELDRPVPFREGGHYFEAALKRGDGETNKGAFGRAVRNLPDHEYDLILQAGFATWLGAEREEVDRKELPGLAEEQALFERPIMESVVSRRFREASFARHVKTAYDNTCAVTGIRLINGGGRSEVQAAHIRPVAADGPDSVRNGIALSGTIHWMFDRGLISVDDDYSILTAQDRIPDTVARMMNPDRRLILPPSAELRPHSQFLRYHRETVFKG